MTGWSARTAVQISAAVRERRLDPRDVVAECLSRIDELDGRIGAFRRVRAEEALHEADEVAERGDLADLPLAGVPVAVKDNLPVRGESCRHGSAATDERPAGQDHPVVARLRDAGAVVIGLTHLPELGVFGTTDSVFGTTRNPWDLARTAGGSSGGSAAAVAAGMVPLAVGNDGMGSIRIPAASCGVVGLKPGTGQVPAGLGVNSWFDMAENGPFATSAEDARLLYSALADAPATAAEAGERLRIAVSAGSPLRGVPVALAYGSAARTAGAALLGSGHRVEQADPPYPWWLGATALTHWTAAVALETRELDGSLLTRRTRVHAAIGERTLPLVRRGTGRERLRRLMEGFFAHHDILVMPALARRGPAAAAWHTRGWLRNTVAGTVYAPTTPVWNLTGWPALSVPFGSLSTGAPCAVQLVGVPGSEGRLLSLAAELERLRPWQRTAADDF